MTQSMASRPADLGLAAWLTPFVARRRVLWIGDASTGGAEWLAGHAELVRVLDTSGRARRKRGGGAVRVSPFRSGPIELAGDSFEVAVVTEVAAFEDLRARVGDLARIVGEDGWIVAGAEARGDARYEALRDALGDIFREVKVIGQSPFRGIALADLSCEDDTAEVSIDGSLLGESALERFYAIAGEELPPLDDYLVVQLPSESAVTTSVDLPAQGDERGRTSPGTHAALEEALVGRAREADALRDAFERAEARLAQLQARLVGTEAELAEARAALRDGSVDEEATKEVGRLEAKLRDRGARVRELEQEVACAHAVLRDAVEELREHQLGRRRGGGAALLDAESARAEAELAIDELRLSILARDEELAALRGRERDGSELEANRTERESSRRDHEAELEALRASLREHEAELAALRASRGDDEKELVTLRASRGDHEAELAALRARQAELLEREGALRAENESLLRARDEALAGHRARDVELTELRTSERDAAARERALRAELEALRVTAAPSEAEGADDEARRELEASEWRLSRRVGELSGQLVAANDLIARLEAQLREAGGPRPSDDEADVLARLEEERDRARSETLRLMAQIAALETRVEGMRLGYEVRIAMLGADSVPSAPTGTDAAIERELERVRAELASHHGEREGLRMRVAELEASRTALGSALPPQLSLAELDRLRDEVAALRAENSDLTVRRVDLEQGLIGAEQRAADLAQKIAARDALVMRLQMDLAEDEQASRRDREHLARAREELQRLREALVESSKAVDAKERAEARFAELQDAFRALERRATEAELRVETLEASEAERAQEREASDDAKRRADEVEAQLAAMTSKLAEAEAAAASSAQRAGEGETLRARIETLEGEIAARDALLSRRESALADVRGGLAALRRELDGWRVDEGTAQRRTEITAVGIDAPTEEVSRFVRLEREVEDKDTLLRSLTAQLEERDDRLRALERRLAEEGVQSGSDEEVRRELLELQERVERLHDELSHEREARGLVEDELSAIRRRPVVADEVSRLERALRERESALTEVTTRAGAYERDVESLRRVCAEARDGLESLLGAASDRGDPRTAERIGELLGVLSRFG